MKLSLKVFIGILIIIGYLSIATVIETNFLCTIFPTKRFHGFSSNLSYIVEYEIENKVTGISIFQQWTSKGNKYGSTKNQDKIEAYVSSELSRLVLDIQGENIQNVKKIFDIAKSWVHSREIYPHLHSEMASVLKAMATAKIIAADALKSGSQLKLLLTLEGFQKVIFKQKWYERDFVIYGQPRGGHDRHNGEIAAFHLDRVLDFRRAPLTVGRIINLKEEIMPVATKKLLRTFREKDGNICYFGVCRNCKEEKLACASGEYMEGAVTLWLPLKWSKLVTSTNPFKGSYKEGKLASWQLQKDYCNTVVKRKSVYRRGNPLLDVMDVQIFDYLTGNSDRHEFESFPYNLMIISIDSGKSFGNPYHHEPSVLQPLSQCCLLRNSTWIKINLLKNGVLTEILEEAMKNDPIAPILHKAHLEALNLRLKHVLDTITKCIDQKSLEEVIVEEWNGI